MTRFFPLAALALAGSGLLPAQDELMRKSIPVDSASRFTLDVDFGSVRVTPGEGATIEVLARRGSYIPAREWTRMKRDLKLEVTRQGSEVRVRCACPDVNCDGYRHWASRIEFQVQLPARLTTDFHTRGGSIDVGDMRAEVTARTSGGSLHFGRIEGPVNGTTSGGSITLVHSQGRSTIRTSGGSIHVENVTGDLEAYTSGGSINIAGAAGKVVAHTSGGSIHVGRATNAVDASTSGGGIDVAMVSNAAFEVDASATGGGVSSDFSVSGMSRRAVLRGAVNGGGPLVRLRTSGGGIHLRRAG
jgi:hypothetical protein